MDVLLWLLKANKRPKALRDLYLASRFSEPTVRDCLRAFQDGGYVVIRSSDDDMRTRCAIATEKLDRLLCEYQEQFVALSRLALPDRPDSIGSGAIAPTEEPTERSSVAS